MYLQNQKILSTVLNLFLNIPFNSATVFFTETNYTVGLERNFPKACFTNLVQCWNF
jgi:hypothetical protein